MQNATSNLYQQHIPWWGDISPAVMTELELPIIVPPAQMVDVIIIGGGVAGLSAALSSRSTGAQVLLLEKEAFLGYGATGRNAGILSAGINMGIADLPPASPHRAFWPETTHVLHTLVAEATQSGSLLAARLTGSLSLAETKNAARKLAREAHSRQEAGLQAHLWTPAQVTAATQGRLNIQSVLNALWLPDEGRIQPLTLLAHLAKQARASGVLLAGHAHVIHYQETTSGNSKHHWQLTLADGSIIRSHALINAVGPTTQPNARIYALAFTADLPATFPLFWAASPYTYTDFRPGNGRLGVSGGRYGRAGITRHDARYHQHLADAARHWLPELSNQEPSATWAVDLQVAADMVPTLRDLGTATPGLAIEGLGALGVLPGIVLGRRAGALVTT